MRDHAQHVVGVARDHVAAGDARLEAERRALDRRRDAARANVGQDVGDVDGVLRALLAAPVRLVDLLLHHVVLEVAVDERVHGVEIHVVVGEEFLQLVALGWAVGERLGRVRRQAEHTPNALLGRDALLHLRQIGVERIPQLLPVVGGMHERRIGQVAEAVAEIHVFVSCFCHPRWPRSGPRDDGRAVAFEARSLALRYASAPSRPCPRRPSG